LRRLFAALLAVVLVVSGAIAVMFAWVNHQGAQTGKPVNVSIKSGASGASIADSLQREGVVRSGLAFRLYLKTRGIKSQLKSGQYQLRTDMPLAQLIQALERGPQLEFFKLVLPEGLNIQQTAAQVGRLTRIQGADFLQAATAATVRPAILPEASSNLEGFLFPATYFVKKDEGPDSVVRRLVTEFEKRFPQDAQAKASALGRTPYEILIIASMIEKEAKANDERGKISAVIHNRLKQGMTLGIDATIQYAVKKYNGQPLTKSDLAIDSPFNTRKRAGLPPSPISNPRLASIEAALNPDPVDSLYYVLSGDCVHHVFTKDIQSFQRANARQPKNC